MAPTLVQSAANSVAKYESRTCTATFATPTTPGRLIVVVGVCAGALPSSLVGPPGFTLLADRGLRDLEMAVWYRQNAPATTAVTVGYEPLTMRSIQVRAMEYSGMAQANVVDQIVARADETDFPLSGLTGTTAQADELVLAFVANQYASAVQTGFSGGLTRLFESVSPQYWQGGSNQDWERARLTIHQTVTTSSGSFFITSLLSSVRRWLTVVVTFRGGSLGPARFTSTVNTNVLTQTGRGSLTVFGPLRSLTATSPALSQAGVSAEVFPFTYQYRLNGFLISGVEQDGPYRVTSHDGLYGYGVRTSDADQPRGDGSLRGIDLQSARQILFEIEISSDPDSIELLLDTLYAALVPRRDTDFDLVWRHPAHSARLLRCRAVDLPRVVDQDGTIVAKQPISLLAADPRHYSARSKQVTVPVTPASSTDPVTVNVTNEGNIAAYPVITITGPTSGPPVSAISLVNSTSLVSFDVQVTLPKGSTLVGDMQARITGAPRSVVTLDGQSKYGSWQLPREPFRLDADPAGQLGYNVLYLETTPPGAPVTCTLEYRDTWSG